MGAVGKHCVEQRVGGNLVVVVEHNNIRAAASCGQRVEEAVRVRGWRDEVLRAERRRRFARADQSDRGRGEAPEDSCGVVARVELQPDRAETSVCDPVRYESRLPRSGRSLNPGERLLPGTVKKAKQARAGVDPRQLRRASGICPRAPRHITPSGDRSVERIETTTGGHTHALGPCAR